MTLLLRPAAVDQGLDPHAGPSLDRPFRRRRARGRPRLGLASERSGDYRTEGSGDVGHAAGPSTGDQRPLRPRELHANEPGMHAGVAQGVSTHAFDPQEPGTHGVDAHEPGTHAVDAHAVLARLDVTVAAVGSVDLGALSDRHLDDHLGRLRRPIAALEAARARALAEVERRARAARPPERQSAEVQETRRRAAKDQGMTPSEAKRSAEAGHHARRHRATGDAFDRGDIGPTHVRLIGEALERLPEHERGGAEVELLELARAADAVAFGRAVRALLARRAPRAASEDERRRHRDRSFRMADTADGGVAFSGLAFGSAAELARTALSAFRRPDTPDEHRTPEQRGADAFEQLCAASLRLDEAPTAHGERPQVIVVIDEDQLDQEGGAARFAGSDQPVTMAEAGTLLDDCSISRIVRSAAGTPIEASKSVRTVPSGLWRALLVRDGGCRWEGCDAPAAWCDVAHGQRAYHDGGRLSPTNAVLLCRRHHRRFDQGPWRLKIVGDRVSFHREVVPFVHPLDRDAMSRAGPDPGVASGPKDALKAHRDGVDAGDGCDGCHAGDAGDGCDGCDGCHAGDGRHACSGRDPQGLPPMVPPEQLPLTDP